MKKYNAYMRNEIVSWKDANGKEILPGMRVKNSETTFKVFQLMGCLFLGNEEQARNNQTTTLFPIEDFDRKELKCKPEKGYCVYQLIDYTIVED